MLFWFFWIWVVWGAVWGLVFAWGCLRKWGMEILIPMYFGFYGSVIWWIAYLVLDKIASHISFH